jgi:dihydrofolate synthase / folylpolyglutamate synthase
MNLDAWLDRISQLHPKSWDLGLARVQEVGRRLDVLRPAEHLFLVAGTNGKGSACEAIDQLCRRRGLGVGKSTSPHLVRFNERIVIDGKVVSDQQLCEAFARIDSARGEISLTYFEFGALASLLIFRDARVDVAVLEIGLGGRMDAMNIVDPDVSVITRIALDHEAWLGHDRATIAVEKAGIMRPRRPCVIGDPEPPPSLESEAVRTGALAVRAGRNFGARDGRLFFTGLKGAVTYQDPGEAMLPRESLIAALQAVICRGWDPSQADVDFLFQHVSVPGRFQRVPGPRTTLLDVAHNPDAAAWLASRLQTLSFGRCHAVFGMYGDKNYTAVMAALDPVVDRWYVCQVAEPRAADADLLIQCLSRSGASVAGKYAKVALAYDAATADSKEDDLILVFGSFPVVGAVMDHLRIAV